VLKPKSFVIVRLQGTIDKINQIVMLLDSGPYITALVPVILYNTS
jgi:hypothetical protein